jgi:F-type H+-transporting ATPase subunit a
MHISLAAETLFTLGPIVITNSILTGLIGSVVIILLFWMAGRAVTVAPKSGLTNIIESLSEFILNLIEQVTHSREKAKRFFPLLMTFFVFILINNWIGLLPGVGSLTIQTAEGAVPLFRGANADLNTTLALAITSVLATQVYAIRSLGLFKHLKKYFSLNPIMLFIGLLELISEVSRMISFSFRLFGNVFAGEVLLIVISGLLPLVGPLPFFGLELFVGAIQALVFTLLTLVFLEMATTEHGDNDSHAHSTPQPAHQPSLSGPQVDTVQARS